jgi:hypothetical protein
MTRFVYGMLVSGRRNKSSRRYDQPRNELRPVEDTPSTRRSEAKHRDGHEN